MQADDDAAGLLSRWRHFALTYEQPYTMVCQGGGYRGRGRLELRFQRRFQHRDDVRGDRTSRRNRSSSTRAPGPITPRPSSRCPIAWPCITAQSRCSSTDGDGNIEARNSPGRTIEPEQVLPSDRGQVHDDAAPARTPPAPTPTTRPSMRQRLANARNGGRRRRSFEPSDVGRPDQHQQRRTGRRRVDAQADQLPQQISRLRAPSQSYTVTISVRSGERRRHFRAVADRLSTMQSVADSNGLTGAGHRSGAPADRSRVRRQQQADAPRHIGRARAIFATSTSSTPPSTPPESGRRAL